jgi:hypothetical protein
MVAEIVTQRRSREAPPQAPVTVFGCERRTEPRPRVLAVQAATSGPDRLGTV